MNAMDATRLLAGQISSIWSTSPSPIVVKLESVDSVDFTTIEEAIQYINQYHLQMLENAKSFILKLIETGAGGSAKMTPMNLPAASCGD